jgi:hypothetical protein
MLARKGHHFRETRVLALSKRCRTLLPRASYIAQQREE